MKQILETTSPRTVFLTRRSLWTRTPMTTQPTMRPPKMRSISTSSQMMRIIRMRSLSTASPATKKTFARRQLPFPPLSLLRLLSRYFSHIRGLSSRIPWLLDTPFQDRLQPRKVQPLAQYPIRDFSLIRDRSSLIARLLVDRSHSLILECIQGWITPSKPPDLIDAAGRVAGGDSGNKASSRISRFVDDSLTITDNCS